MTSSQDSMAEEASIRLTSQAEALSRAIFAVLNERGLTPSYFEGYRTACEVATKLHLISIYLRSLPPYWIQSDVEKLCRTVLQELQAVTQRRRAADVNPRLSIINYLFNQNDKSGNIVGFFQGQEDKARSLNRVCGDLVTKLTIGGNNAEEPPDALQHLDAQDASADINVDLFNALQTVAECDMALHGAGRTATAPSEQTLWHPARLCLVSPCVNILVAATDLTLWQEFCLGAQPEISPDDGQQLLGRGGFCSVLEKDITARLFLSFKQDHGLFLLRSSQLLREIVDAGPGTSLATVLRNYVLTPKDKVVLAYAIARSCWQYYDSELMRIKWASDTIWFMPEEVSRGHDDRLPLRAYLSFPFGTPGSAVPEVLDDDWLNHRYPRIFNIGVLLLEIGLAKPFCTTAKRRGNRTSQANLIHKIANDEMRELERTDWDGFANSKKYFDAAVSFCLDGKNFIPPPQQPGTGQHGPAAPIPIATDSSAAVLARRRILYKNVVRPLAWLVKSGFKTRPEDVSYLNKKLIRSSPSVPHTTAMPFQPESEALFHNSAVIPKMWLRDLLKISNQVETLRREGEVTTRVRIAILDTGFNRDLPVFRDNGRMLESVIYANDFVESKPKIRDMKDTFGHGTFMARLIMACAPGAEIVVARVAASTKQLSSSQGNIKKAILWAGKTADIISMSFGFQRDDPGISEAIEAVRKQRSDRVIFFASAGNSSTDDESFPARHPSVISVYATNCHGRFLQSNAVSTSNGADLLGAYGANIPSSIREQLESTYPGVCEPGSSVATAVMAGISATMLLYASVLPSLVPLRGIMSSDVLQHLWTGKGMEALLRRLAPLDPERPRLKAVNPIKFWKDRANHAIRYCAICDALAEIDKKSPRPSGRVES